VQDSSKAAAPANGIEIFQTILTALILAFVFRAFFVEAFIIPTGSMAEGLLGRHGHLVCPKCGWEFSFGPAMPAGDEAFIAPETVICPNCDRPTDPGQDPSIQRAGDRVIVHKWPFEIGGPFGIRRWDVIVFRDPADPESNYIKRVVGLPDESVEIIRGDVYIASAGDPSRIARKSAAAQQVLWTVVHDQNHRPTPLGQGASSSWQSDGGPDSGWSGLNTRVLRFSPNDSSNAIRFVSNAGHETIYDDTGNNNRLAENAVRDLRVGAELTLDRSGAGARLRIELTCDDTQFEATFAADGEVTLEIEPEGAPRTQVAHVRSAELRSGVPVRVELTQVDYRAAVSVAGVELIRTNDSQYQPPRSHSGRPMSFVRLIGHDSPLTLRNVRIDRDVYYTQSYRSRRAIAGEPFHLNAHEYFVLGDNSANSHDAREWYRVGPHMRGRDPAYRAGTVVPDQIVGRAFFVYLPSLVPGANGSVVRVPDVGRVRFVR
jgi:signal peptidase I